MNFGISRTPKKIIFGNGQRSSIAHHAAEFGKKTLICTDERFSLSNEMQVIKSELASAGIRVKVFDGVEPELPLENIESCVEDHKGFQPDSIIGIGGGSCMDLAKVVSLMLTYEGDINNFYGEYKVPGNIIPVLAVPTTSGTGSEVTPVAVIADHKRDMKIGISSPYLIPEVAICDPELTVSCPPTLTAISGVDALTHAIEAYTAKKNDITGKTSTSAVFVGQNIISDFYAVEAIKKIFGGLVLAYNDGSNIQARSDMMLGSLLAGMAFSTAGTSAAHAIQYPIGALTNTPHGLGVGVLLPFVMEFNKNFCLDKYANIYEQISMSNASMGKNEKVEMAIQSIKNLLLEVNFPASISSLGVRDDQFDWIAKKTMDAARLVKNNPRELDYDGVIEILNQSFL